MRYVLYVISCILIDLQMWWVCGSSVTAASTGSELGPKQVSSQFPLPCAPAVHPVGPSLQETLLLPPFLPPSFPLALYCCLGLYHSLPPSSLSICGDERVSKGVRTPLYSPKSLFVYLPLSAQVRLCGVIKILLTCTSEPCEGTHWVRAGGPRLLQSC